MKVGDQVIIQSRYNMALQKIHRETKKYWVVGAMKFRKINLQLAGGGDWNTTRLLELTDENYLRYKTYRLQNYDIRARYSCLSVDQQDKIHTLVEKYTKLNLRKGNK